VRQLQESDPELRAHRRRVSGAQLDSCRRLAEWLDADGVLAAAWTTGTAADLLYGLIASDLFERLLGDRRWSAGALGDTLSLLLRGALTTTGEAPPRRRRRPT